MKNINLLIVDDETQNYEKYIIALQEACLMQYQRSIQIKAVPGISHKEVFSGSKILLEEIGNYDIVLMDIIWKDRKQKHATTERKGIEFCKMIKNEFPELPIIIFSERANVDDFKELIEYLNGYISKGSQPAQWAAEIERVIRNYIEDSGGQAIYKHVRNIKSYNGWEKENIYNAATVVWTSENGHTKWKGFWDILTKHCSDKKILRAVNVMSDAFKESDLIAMGGVPSMRGHLEHVLQVFFTGYVLINSLPEFKKTTLDRIKQLLGVKYLPEDEPIYWDTFNIAWLVAATLHDTAYSFELLPEIISKLKQIVSVYPESYSSDILQIPIAAENKWIIPNQADQVVKDIFNNVVTKLHSNGINSEWIFTNYLFESSKGGKRINHGVLAGIIYVSKIIPQKNAINEEQKNLFEILSWAGIAMSLHSLKIPGAKNKKCIVAKDDPLSFMLMLCDEIQVWNRDRPDKVEQYSKYRMVDLIDLSIDSFNINAKIKYTLFNNEEHNKEARKILAVEIQENETILKNYLVCNPFIVNIEYYISDDKNCFSKITLT